jgi:hypothetical protein
VKKVGMTPKAKNFTQTSASKEKEELPTHSIEVKGKLRTLNLERGDRYQTPSAET